MSRPRLHRRIGYRHRGHFFKPRGVPMRNLEVIELTAEEAEALRLKNIKELSQIQCAQEMKTSQSTFQRILTSAYKKISIAIIKGKAIKIIKK